MAAFKLNLADLVFVLKQIKIAEAHASGTPLTEIWVDKDGNVVPAGTPGAILAIPSPMAPFGLRTVDGTLNNIVPGRETWGAADQEMPRLLPSYYRNEADGDQMPLGPPGSGAPTITNNDYGIGGSVADADPRLISNLVADMSFNNPAAIVAALSYAEFNGEFSGEIYGPGGALETIQNAFAALRAVLDNPHTPEEAAAANAAFDAVLDGYGVEHNGASISIPNIAPDEGLSVPFNAWMTFFGQFFDHGLDLINKGGNGTVYVPLNPDDPLMTHGADGIAGTGDELSLQQNSHLAFMALTRATPSGESEVNQTTPFVDQNQTYTSNASHQAFLREYHLVGDPGVPQATGHLLDGSDGNDAASSLPTWADVKAQALNMLGIQLTDLDVGNIPVLRMDPYGEFVRGPNGMPQILAGVDVNGNSIWVETSLSNPINPSAIQLPVGTVLFGGNVIEDGETVSAVRTGHAFLDDIAHTAVPGTVFDHDNNPLTAAIVVQADGDNLVGNSIATDAQGRKVAYDNELLDQHYITGDGRGNENIGLTTVHHVFHSEHNRQVEQQQRTILEGGDLAFLNEWLLTDITQEQYDAVAGMTPLELNAFAATLNWDGERLFQAARMATEMQYQHLVFEEFARKIQPAIDPFVFNTTPDIDPSIFAEFAHVVYRFGHSMLTDNMPRINGQGLEIPAMKADGTPLTAEEFGLVASFLNPIAFDNDGALTDDQGAAAIIRGMTIERGNEIDEFLVDALRNNLLGLPLDLAAINIARGRDTGMPSLNQAREALFAASGSTFLEPYANWIDFAGNLKHPVSVVNFIAAYGTHESITTATTADAKREAAWLLVMGGEGAPADRMQFLTATGAYADKGGLNEIDLWIGGLAEKKMPFGGFLGSTFNAVFELQLENLQDGDRFYYLTRTQGQNFLNALEENAFAKMMMANTDLAQPGADGIRGTADDIIERHIGIDSFGVYDHVLEVNVANQQDYNTASPEEIAAATQARDDAQADYDAAVAASDAADQAAADAADALAAAQAAAAADAVALRAAANTAQSQADALNTSVELGALLTALVAANSSDAAALQAAANAAQAVADATDAVALQDAATAAAADDAAAAAAQTLADETDATALQADADAAAAADQAAADAVVAAADAAQAEADAQAALAAAQATLDTLIGNNAPQTEIDDATIVRDAAQTTYDNAVLASDTADQAVIDTQAIAAATDAAALQADATAAAADDAAAAAAQAVADATDAVALQDAAAQAAADDAAAVAAQAAASAAASADAGLMTALNNYITALAADQAADAAAAAADAIADAAEAADAVEAAAAAAATAANTAAATAATAEAAALAALNQAQADLAAASVDPAGKDPVGNNPVLEAMGLGKVVRDDPTTVEVETNYIRVQGGEHTVIGGTNDNDTIIADFGDDAIWGGDGDDRIEAGAGVDLVNGGGGNDIITDSGDTGDFLKGEEGDDVIANSNGLDVIMGGSGKDVVFVGVDDTEVFGGEGDDFILGGAGVDFLLGNEGDDWMEGGPGFDTTAGDNSELFFDSRIIGHDVMFSGSEEHDFDAESGDDIMVQGESVIRNEGMFGFDWATYKGSSKAADADLGRPIFTTEVEDILRNRFDKVEGLSGWDQDDLLIGDDRGLSDNLLGVVNATAEGVFFRDEIDAEGIARIDGLDEVITAEQMFEGIYGSDFSDNVQTIFSGGNVILGGGGSDTIAGKGGNDIIDGDRWLNVRIRITEAGESNTAENQIATIDSLSHVFASDFSIEAWRGKSVFELMLDRTIVPNQLHIVREIITDDGVGDTDVAVFWDVIDNYSFSAASDGALVVSHTGFDAANLPADGTFRVSDGVDTLRNIEMLRFGDGNGGTVDVPFSQLLPQPATGQVILSDLTPTEGGALSFDASSVADPNGLGPFTFQWQQSANGVDWTNIANATNATFTPVDLPGTAFGPQAGQQLRVVVSFTDGRGYLETITSNASGPTGVNWTAQPLVTNLFNGTAGDDIARAPGGAFGGNDALNGGGGNDLLDGGSGNDSLNGEAGDDTLFGGEGQDTLLGGTGNDTLNGNAGNDFLSGEVGDDLLRGQAGDDILTGGAGNDTLFGNGGADTLFGDDGDDNLFGGTGNDTLNGNAGNDSLNGEAGDDLLLGQAGDDILTGGAGNDTLVGNGGTDTANFVGTLSNFRVEGVDSQVVLTDTVGVEGRDTFGPDIEVLRVNGTNYTTVYGNNGNQTVTGNGASNALFGFAGNDTLNGQGASDILHGGAGNDTINAGGGNDFIYQTGATDGRDSVVGGGGVDTYILQGVEGAETFRIYTRAAAVAAGMTGIAPGTEIVITRNGTDNASIIAELTSIEEIRINSLLHTSPGGSGQTNADGDTIAVFGDFTQTSLDYNTIRIAGDVGNDTIDISNLTSAHRVVFDSNGGTDTVVGQVRDQDVFSGESIIDMRVGAADPIVGTQVSIAVEGGVQTGVAAPAPEGGVEDVLLNGGSGANVFRFGEGDGIADLVVGEISADLAALGVNGGNFWDMVSVSRSGADAWGMVGLERGHLAGVGVNDLDLTNFILEAAAADQNSAELGLTMVRDLVELAPLEMGPMVANRYFGESLLTDPNQQFDTLHRPTLADYSIVPH